MKKVLVILIALCLALSLVACGGGATQQGSSTPAPANTQQPDKDAPPEQHASETSQDAVSARDTLTVAVTMDIGTLNSREMWPGDFKTLSRMYSEPLLDFYGNGDIRWILATGIDEVSDSQMIVHLREGVKFTNGSDFKANDVMFSLQDYAWLFFRNIDMENSRILDDYTIELNLTYYDNTMLYSLPLMGIIDEETFDAEKNATAPVGTGPYIVTDYVVASYVKMTRNEDYWGTPAKIQNLEFKVLNEDSQRVIALETKTADTVSVPTQDLDYVKTIPGYEVSVREGDSACSIFFNVTDMSCLNSTAARKAVAHAIDRQAIANIVFFGYAAIPDWPLMTCCTDYDPSFANLDPVFSEGYNPELAKKYAEEAGLFGKEIRIITDGTPNYVKMAELVEQYLKDIGLTTSITNYDASSFLVVRENPETHDMWLGSLSHPGLSGAGAYQGNVRNTPYFWNYDWERSDEFKELSQAVVGINDKAEVKATLLKLTEMFSDCMLWYPICQPDFQNAYDADLGGVEFMLLGGAYYNDWYWTK